MISMQILLTDFETLFGKKSMKITDLSTGRFYVDISQKVFEEMYGS